MKQIEARHRCGAGNLAGESPDIRMRLQANGAVRPLLQLVLAETGQPGSRVLSTACTAAWALSNMLQDSSNGVCLRCCAVNSSLLATNCLLVHHAIDIPLLNQAAVLVGTPIQFVRWVQSSQMMLCTGQRGACCPWSCPGLGPAPQLQHKPRVAS